MTLSSILLALAFPALYAILSYLGGFARIARLYPVLNPPTGDGFYFAWGTINSITFKRGLDLVVGTDGLYIGPIFLLRLLNPPAFLPWDRVIVAQDNPHFVDKAIITIPELNIKIQIPGKAAKAILSSASTFSRVAESSLVKTAT